MDRLVRAGRFADAPGLLRVEVRRAYAAEASAAQTGMGSASTRDLIGAVRNADVLAVSALDDDSRMVDTGGFGRPVAPAWMRALVAVLAMEGRAAVRRPGPLGSPCRSMPSVRLMSAPTRS